MSPNPVAASALLLSATLAALLTQRDPERMSPSLPRLEHAVPELPRSPVAREVRPSLDPASGLLAARVRAALAGKKERANDRPAPSPIRREPAAGTERRWRCGDWVELWQGSGKGRTCEWRSIPARPSREP